VTGTFKASFVIDEEGKMVDLSVKPTEKDETKRNNRIVVIGYASSHGEKNAAVDRSEGINKLMGEIERTIKTLPEWHPAIHEEKKVAVKMNMYFQFNLE